MAGHERAVGASEAGPCHDIVLWVRLAAGEHFTGFVGSSATDLSHPFGGWIDFMGAVNALRVAIDADPT
jgi:hypothetical protein